MNVYKSAFVLINMKGVFVVLDGGADEPCQILGQITPLQAAKTPNLDLLASNSKIYNCYTVKEGFVPESDNAIVSLLGYDFISENRGALEAKGLGINLKNGDLALRCNFATVDDLEQRNILDRRAGRTLSTEEAAILGKSINEKVKLPFKFEFHNGIQHRGVLVIRGGFSNNISNIEEVKGRLEFSKPLDEQEDSKFAADLINSFIRQSHEVLDRHPINIVRARKGLYSANVILCRGAGNEPARFKKLKGKWMALAYMPLEIGIALAAGMNIYRFDYPKLKGIDVYENLYSGLNKAIKYSIKMLKKFKDRYDYFFIHFKETDLPGHDNKPLDKVRMIEILDKEFFSFLKGFIDGKRLIITADHTTSCRRKGHTADPVPVLVYPFEEKSEQRFTEEQGLKGKKIGSRSMLEKYLLGK